METIAWVCFEAFFEEGLEEDGFESDRMVSSCGSGLILSSAPLLYSLSSRLLAVRAREGEGGAVLAEVDRAATCFAAIYSDERSQMRDTKQRRKQPTSPSTRP